jgi:nucleotide-binding universal stress UspA family protein
VEHAHVTEQLRDALVVAVDGSPPSARALRFAADLADETGRALHVLMVWNVIIGRRPAPRVMGL